MNAGYLPIDHWVYSEEGGGRIIGEACHIIDLFSYFIGSSATEINTSVLGEKRDIFGIFRRTRLERFGSSRNFVFVVACSKW